MNEEDIIDILENVFIFKNTNDKFTKLDLEAINGLLKLYKQEKEKNKKLEEVIDMMANDYIQDYLYNERSDYPCEYYYGKIKKKDGCKQGKIGVCEECLKEYYFKVAKGEEYKNKYCGGED